MTANLKNISFNTQNSCVNKIILTNLKIFKRITVYALVFNFQLIIIFIEFEKVFNKTNNFILL